MPWVWGAMYRAGESRRQPARALGRGGGTRGARAVRRALRLPPTCSTASSPCANTSPTEPHSRRRASRSRPIPPPLQAPRRTGSGSANGSTVAYPAIPDRADALLRARSRTQGCSCARRPSPRRGTTALPRGHLSADEAIEAAFGGDAVKRLLLTHRPAEPGCPRRGSSARTTASSSRSRSTPRAGSTASCAGSRGRPARPAGFSRLRPRTPRSEPRS